LLTSASGERNATRLAEPVYDKQSSHDVFKLITSDDIHRSAQQLLTPMTDGKIRRLVQSSSLTSEDKQFVTEHLIKRRDALLQPPPMSSQV
jgi:hypothetical protein